eukprot:TRINITY_DN532_c0_g1_i1.p1 TRINITY_DN532_c0_g1~~TRINITY_DN532_c0_g1_i1.p1  ORF type:complete len:493 (+),score=129.40 TRINITY_DN532_c0_g1_i1:37-1515(+)
MFVFVKTLTGKTLTIEVNENDTIAETKKKIEQRSEVPASQQRIVFAGKDLDDSKTLEECGVKKESIIHLVIKKNEEVLAQMTSTERVLMKTAQENLKLKSYYNSSAGLNEELDTYKDDNAKFDVYNNPEGIDFDLGRDGKFKKFKVVLGAFYKEGPDGQTTMGKPAAALRKKGFQIMMTTDELKFTEGLETADVAIIMSNMVFNSTFINNDLFVKRVLEFHKRGGGLFLMGDNQPYYLHVNLLLPKLLGQNVQLTGNTPGTKTLTLGDPKATGKFAGGHLITSGIIKLYEGITIAYPTTLGPLKLLATSSNGNPIICYADNECLKNDTVGRIVLDGGFTKCWYEWDTAGSARYMVNSVIWLLGLEQRVANNQPILSRSQVLRRQARKKSEKEDKQKEKDDSDDSDESEDEDEPVDFSEDLKTVTVEASDNSKSKAPSSSSSSSSSSSFFSSQSSSSSSSSSSRSAEKSDKNASRTRSFTGSLLSFFKMSKQA